MRITHPLFTGMSICLIGTALALPAQQEEQRDTKRQEHGAMKMKKQTHITLEKMLDARVRLKMHAGNDEESGQVKDLIVDPMNGALRWAVLGIGPLMEDAEEKTVAVPIAALECHPEGMDSATITVRADADQLKKLASFDLERARESGLVPALQAVEASWIAIGEPAEGAYEKEAAKDEEKESDEEVVVRGTAIAAAPMALACASEMGDWPVRASDGELGEVSQVLLQVHSQPYVDYVVVSSGGVLGIGDTEFLVPFEAVKLAKPEQQIVWEIHKSQSEMEKAPKYEKPEKGLVDPKDCGRAHEFYGVEKDHDERAKAMQKKAEKEDMKRAKEDREKQKQS